MDQSMLVESHKDDGKRLLERLDEEGIGVTAAAWLKEGQDGYWHLYIASPIVDEEESIRNVYGRIHDVTREMPEPFWIGRPGEIRLISPSDRITKAILELQQQYRGNRAIELGHGEAQLGGMTISGAYIYPPVPAPVS